MDIRKTADIDKSAENQLVMSLTLLNMHLILKKRSRTRKVFKM